MRRICLVLIVTAAIPPLQADEDHSVWWYARAKLACIPDVIRLCKASMPDQDKVTACMKTKKSLVSPDCAEFYPGGKNAD